MEIVIGTLPKIGAQEKKRRIGNEEVIEARVLNMRYPRKPYGLPPMGREERRQRHGAPDPLQGRIMTILIPEAFSIPRDAASGKYKILMRFVANR